MRKQDSAALTLHPIGVIRTPFSAKGHTPIQGAFHPEARGIVEVLPELERGLQDIEGFSHLILLYHLDRAAPVKLVRPMLLSDDPHGIFAARHPARPNPVGLTIVRLLERAGASLTVAGIDVLDGTPLLDIKPYVARFDSVPDATEGWFTGRGDRPKPAGRE